MCRWLTGIIGLGIAAAGLGCAEVPGTGRQQLMLVSENQEHELALAIWQGAVSQMANSDDLETKEILERVANRLIPFANRPDFDWRIKLVKSEQVNAFCLPGGKIVVYEGILPIMKNEAGMAAVLGHEMAHAVARHAAERISRAQVAQMLARGLAGGLGQYAPGWENVGMQVFGISNTLGVALPFSRSHESEADYLGLIYMAKAGYDPAEAVRLWERMAAAAKKRGRTPEFLSTHPQEQRRIKRLNEKLEEASALYQAAPAQYQVGENLPVKLERATIVVVE